MEDLEVRLHRLERNNRRLQGCVLALFVMLGLTFGSPALQSEPKEVTADTINARQVNITHRGRTAATLHSILGDPMIALYDHTGKERARLAVQSNGASLTMSEDVDNPRIRLSATGKESTLSLIDVTGSGNVFIKATPDSAHYMGSAPRGSVGISVGPNLAFFQLQSENRMSLSLLDTKQNRAVFAVP